jgi:hypothetical protein
MTTLILSGGTGTAKKNFIASLTDINEKEVSI